MNKKILDKLQELQDKNRKLFDRKARFEEQILNIDIEIFQISGEYSKLIRELEEEYANKLS